MLKGESTFLQVDLSQSTTKEQESKALSLGGGLGHTLATCPARALPPKAEDQISMTMEVSALPSPAVLDTSGLASRSSTPKDQGPWPWPHHYLLSWGILPNQWITSSQVSIPDDTEMDENFLEEIHASPSLPVKTPGPSSEAPSLDVTWLQEKANKALGHLLVTRFSINTHQRK